MPRFNPEAEREEARAFGRRLRATRIAAGLTLEQTACAAETHHSTLVRYELGEGVPRPARLARIASALCVPVAQLLGDQVVLAEIRLSSETLELIKREGRPAAIAAVERITDNLVALALAEATRPPVDLSPGTRAKPRRSREQVLVGIAGARASREARRQKELDSRRLAVAP